MAHCNDYEFCIAVGADPDVFEEGGEIYCPHCGEFYPCLYEEEVTSALVCGESTLYGFSCFTCKKHFRVTEKDGWYTVHIPDGIKEKASMVAPIKAPIESLKEKIRKDS